MMVHPNTNVENRYSLLENVLVPIRLEPMADARSRWAVCLFVAFVVFFFVFCFLLFDGDDP